MSAPVPSSKPRTRKPAPSDIEDERTNILSTRSVERAALSAPIPAAGRPPTMPPPGGSRPSVRPAAPRAHDDDDDDGRTVVRSAPVSSPDDLTHAGTKRNRNRTAKETSPTSISPPATIKPTDSARMGQSRREPLLAGPPRDLLEDRADFDAMAVSRAPVSFEGPSRRAPVGFELAATAPGRTFDSPSTSRSGLGGPNNPSAALGSSPLGLGASAPFEGPRSARNMGPPSSASASILEGPPSRAPYSPRAMTAPQSSARAGAKLDAAPFSRSAAMPAPSSQSHIAAGAPAHFRTPRASVDPPATSISSASHRVAGRPGLSWVAVLAACGLFVGVTAVALMQSSDTLAETSASFVDPSRAPSKSAASPPPPSTSASPPPPAQGGQGGSGGLIGASPVQAPPPEPTPVAAQAQPAQTPPGQAPPGPMQVGQAPPGQMQAGQMQPGQMQPGQMPPGQVQPGQMQAGQMQPGQPFAMAQPPAPQPTGLQMAPVAVPPAPAPPKPRPATNGGGGFKQASAPPAKEDPPAKKPPRSSGGDEERRKALEALQKAQLESAGAL